MYALAIDQVSLQHLAGHAVHLVQNAFQPAQLLILLDGARWFDGAEC